MECHKCPYQKALSMGRYRYVPFERTPCASCTPDTGPTFPQEYHDDMGAAADVLSDSPGVPETAFPEEALPEAEPPATLSSLYPVGAFMDVFMALFYLADMDLAVLRLKYRRMSHEQVGSRLGLSVRAVESRFGRILARHPVLGAFFPCRRSGGVNNRGKNR